MPSLAPSTRSIKNQGNISAVHCKRAGRNTWPGTEAQASQPLSAAVSWKCSLSFYLWELHSVFEMGQFCVLLSFRALCLARSIWLDHCLFFSTFFFQMLFFNVPLMAYLCWCLFLRCKGHSFYSHIHHVQRLLVVLIHLAMALLLAWQVYSCYFLQRTYGTLAFVLSPMRTWLVALTSFLIYKTWTFQSSELRTYTIEMKNCQSF